MAETLYDVEVERLDGARVRLADYRGRVLLVVNTASRCGFTPQYEGLQDLHDRHHAAGLEILAFPCNQFGGQEPGDREQIGQFCSTRFGVTFPIHAKIDVNGPGTHPLYTLLKREAKGLLGTEAIKWNFTKFLVDRTGRVVERFSPSTKPEQIEKRIEALLDA